MVPRRLRSTQQVALSSPVSQRPHAQIQIVGHRQAAIAVGEDDERVAAYPARRRARRESRGWRRCATPRARPGATSPPAVRTADGVDREAEREGAARRAARASSRWSRPTTPTRALRRGRRQHGEEAPDVAGGGVEAARRLLAESVRRQPVSPPAVSGRGLERPAARLEARVRHPERVEHAALHVLGERLAGDPLDRRAAGWRSRRSSRAPPPPARPPASPAPAPPFRPSSESSSDGSGRSGS